MSDDCVLGHSWEVYSGDDVNCAFCEAQGRVEIIWEPDDDE